jgi:RNA polymerase-binding protein DksA
MKNQIVADRLTAIRDYLYDEIAHLTVAIEASGDFCDRGQASQEKSKNLALQRVLRERLVDVESAIKRAIDGTYGTCTDCGMQIPLERLEAKPETPRCIECEIKASRRSAGIKTAFPKLSMYTQRQVRPSAVAALA